MSRCFRWLPDFKAYETDSEGSEMEMRLSARWLWFSLNILLWTFIGERRKSMDDREARWGFSFFSEGDLVLSWGLRHVRWELPFSSLVLVSTQVLSIDGRRVVYTEPRRKWKLLSRDHARAFRDEETKAKEANRATFDYRYEQHTGEVQEVTATIEASRSIHRWKWTPFLRARDSIWVSFSAEVGPERGSWKGGVTGCGYTMRKGERPIQCLRRMERERRFER